MGMFDTVQVHAGIIKNLLSNDEDVISYLNSYEESEGSQYLSFQTKSLDNFLDLYTLKEDKCLYKTLCKWVNDDPSHETSEVKTNRTAIVDFYDYFKTEKHFISLEIQMTVIDGELSEMHVTKLDKEPIALHDLRGKHNRLQYEYKETTWEMKVYRLLQKVEWKMWRLFRRVDKYSEFKQWLSQRAEQKLKNAATDQFSL
jgi:predicted SnoaL-like aldol condensation-catalyzing enzyme